MAMDRDELVSYTIENLSRFLLQALPSLGDLEKDLANGREVRPCALGHEDLRTLRAMALTVYLSAMPGHTTLEGPDELMPLMRSDWELLMAAWDEAGQVLEERDGPT